MYEINYLFSLKKHGIKLGLQNMVLFADLLGNPQQKLKIIHIAGTNGKGSCASFIAAILIECGYKTGIYTSPHFVKFNERIRIGREQIDDFTIIDFVQKNRQFIDDNNLTFFEVTTALAFKYFYDNSVDYAIIETGMGGRFDATNICEPVCSVITSIGLEHTEYLGDTIEKIAFEKAGIIKSGHPTFCGILPREAESVVSNVAESKKSILFNLKDYYFRSTGTLSFENLILQNLVSPLRGEYQLMNAALSAMVCYSIHGVSNYSIQTGIKKVLINTGFEGRFEEINSKPQVILDSAHNPDGIKELAKELQSDSNLFSKTTVLFTALRGKDIQVMIDHLKCAADNIVLTTINFERALNFEELNCIKVEAQNHNLILNQNPGKFVADFVYSGEKTERLIVTGSMYLLGEIKSYLTKQQKFFI